MKLSDWEIEFERHLRSCGESGAPDPAHDLAHFRRVVKTAKALAQQEGAQAEVVVPAAWLHDLVTVPKSDPRRSLASKLSADAAVAYLQEKSYPREHVEAIAHAIEAHSFSAGIPARTLEAKVVQDADRLDALGAIGIARLFMVGGQMGSEIYSSADPFAKTRSPDDRRFAIDHFYAKLFKISETLHTAAGREEGARRVGFMRKFLEQLRDEVVDAELCYKSIDE